jgi:hypothetical protein
MTADTLSSHERPAFSGAVKAGAVVSAVFAAALVAGWASLCTARTDQTLTPETEASAVAAPSSKIGRSGIMMAHELLL